MMTLLCVEAGCRRRSVVGRISLRRFLASRKVLCFSVGSFIEDSFTTATNLRQLRDQLPLGEATKGQLLMSEKAEERSVISTPNKPKQTNKWTKTKEPLLVLRCSGLPLFRSALPLPLFQDNGFSGVSAHAKQGW